MMQARCAAAFAACVLLGSTGCAFDAPAGSGWTATIDTLPNGARVVTNTPPARETSPYQLVEELRIGNADGAEQLSFGQVKGIAVLADGRIAVLDAIAQEIRLFSADGAWLRTFGRKGAGPGEMSGAYGMMHGPHDELWVPDHVNNRMSVFHPDSGFVRSYVFNPLRRGFVWDGVMLPDGRIATTSVSIQDQSYRSLVRVFGPDMTQVDSLLMPEAERSDPQDPPGAYYFKSPDGKLSGFMSIPFYPQVSPVLDRELTLWLGASAEPVYTVTRVRPAGDTLFQLRAERRPVPVSAAERDSAIAQLTEAMGRYGAKLPDFSRIPNVKPMVESIFLSDAGDLWVEAASPDTLQRFDVYDREGRHVRSVATSLRIWPYVPPVIQGDTVWAVVVDADDVQYIVRARIAPPAARER